MSARHRPWMVVAAIALAGCSSVPWEDYDPSVKETIDRMAKAGGCPGLQEQFDIADQNNEATIGPDWSQQRRPHGLHLRGDARRRLLLAVRLGVEQPRRERSGGPRPLAEVLHVASCDRR